MTKENTFIIKEEKDNIFMILLGNEIHAIAWKSEVGRILFVVELSEEEQQKTLEERKSKIEAFCNKELFPFNWEAAGYMSMHFPLKFAKAISYKNLSGKPVNQVVMFCNEDEAKGTIFVSRRQNFSTILSLKLFQIQFPKIIWGIKDY